VRLCVTVCVCLCEWRGEFNRVVLVVQLGLIFHFILNPEQRRVFQRIMDTAECLVNQTGVEMLATVSSRRRDNSA
jgi:hypothetical protein